MSNLADLPNEQQFRVGTPSRLPRRFLIHGVTACGKQFRPSDWAERLCGVLAPYRPGAANDQGPPIDFSPYARPVEVDGAKCVRIDELLHQIEPMALTFVLNFARDNDLVTSELSATPA
jgi:hypothetical protein